MSFLDFFMESIKINMLMLNVNVLLLFVESVLLLYGVVVEWLEQLSVISL